MSSEQRFSDWLTQDWSPRACQQGRLGAPPKPGLGHGSAGGPWPRTCAAVVCCVLCGLFYFLRAGLLPPPPPTEVLRLRAGKYP